MIWIGDGLGKYAETERRFLYGDADAVRYNLGKPISKPSFSQALRPIMFYYLNGSMAGKNGENILFGS